MFVLLAACEQQPSKLDDMPLESEARVADEKAWIAIEERALPMSIRNDLLQTAIAFPYRGTIDQAAAALVAWMDAGGSVPAPTTVRASSSAAFELNAPRILELVRAKPEDDRLFEAALYAAWKLRSDGTGSLAAMLSRVLTKRLAELRPVPPAFAAKYAPTDAEVFRLFASEAMFMYRATLEHGEQTGSDERAVVEADLAMSRELASAPTERTAFLAFLFRLRIAHPTSAVADLNLKLAPGMFAAVDDYQKWLGRGPATAPPP